MSLIPRPYSVGCGRSTPLGVPGAKAPKARWKRSSNARSRFTSSSDSVAPTPYLLLITTIHRRYDRNVHLTHLHTSYAHPKMHHSAFEGLTFRGKAVVLKKGEAVMATGLHQTAP